ncbi:glycosyltransferase family 4 protein [Acidisphaera sp. L21]|jgi:glycosyltransferase involved in cell wall biosynthesis|uniref:glycosyltransferase family 4 protein n=1 Tax=Acidisphaera sp. L21 TaxID=1641851 RepID=UPI00131E37D2|nr:glycosyltransferase family 4 protein [Acidisphaera sp. L21]
MPDDLALTVLQVLPSLETGGVERGTVEMVQAIVRAGGSALVASSGGRLVPAVERAGGTHITLKLASKNPARIWRNAAQLAFLIRAADVDIVHARSRAPAWSAWLACRRTGARFVTTWHGVYKENAPGKRRYNAIMARGERIIAISHFVASRLKARHQVDPARLRIIPRGVDTALFDPASVSGDRMARLAREWRLPDGAPIIVLPARLTRWKGHTVMLEALARLERRDVGLVLVGAEQGRTRFRRELIARAEALGIADRVRLVGHCDDMPAALMLADVVANPSIEPEPFGRTVIEAQAMGRPVVVSDAGGTAETVEHGVTGWRVRPSDPVALAAAIDEILRLTPAEREALGARARGSVCAHYTTAAMQQATLEVYRELLA